jgi:hypothetical protein
VLWPAASAAFGSSVKVLGLVENTQSGADPLTQAYVVSTSEPPVNEISTRFGVTVAVSVSEL